MSFETFNLRSNPFRMTPAVSEGEIIWAGFPEIKQKFEKRIKKSVRIPNSTLVLNWGEYGSGKTHASRYFGKSDVLNELAKETNESSPFYVSINLPKGRNPPFEIFVAIIDKIDLSAVYQNLVENVDIQLFQEYIEQISDNIHICSVLKAVFSDLDQISLKRYLYGLSSAKELKELAESHGIIRKLSQDSDYSKLISGLFSCITFSKKIYSCVSLWIDEFEDISILSNVNIEKTNNFLRELLDNTPNNLLVFLNLTQTAMMKVEDLGGYLSEAVKSRIKERIHFNIPSQDDFLLYLRELFKEYRLKPQEDQPLFPFADEGTVRFILEDLGNVSLRRLNESFSLLLELADFDKQDTPLTLEYYKSNKNEIIGWKE
jgi:hypothetical protein